MHTARLLSLFAAGAAMLGAIGTASAHDHSHTRVAVQVNAPGYAATPTPSPAAMPAYAPPAYQPSPAYSTPYPAAASPYTGSPAPASSYSSTTPPAASYVPPPANGNGRSAGDAVQLIECREFRQVVTSEGRRVDVRGAICRDGSGRWHVAH